MAEGACWPTWHWPTQHGRSIGRNSIYPRQPIRKGDKGGRGEKGGGEAGREGLWGFTRGGGFPLPSPPPPPPPLNLPLTPLTPWRSPVGLPRVSRVVRRVEPRRVEPRRAGGPKFRAFFSLSRRKIRSFLLSLGVFSWNFGGV